jgi:hypothetical protein
MRPFAASCCARSRIAFQSLSLGRPKAGPEGFAPLQASGKSAVEMRRVTRMAIPR